MDSRLSALPVTVVVSCREQRTELWRALASVACQTRPASEIIVVDEARDPNTAAIARDYGARVIVSARHGASAARNLAIANGSHAWVALLNDNALWDSRKLERQWDAVTRCPGAGLVLTEYTIFHATSGGPFRSGWPRRESSIARGTGVAQRLLDAGLLNHPSALLKRALWEELGGYDESLSEFHDVEFLLRAIARSTTVVLDDVLTNVVIAKGPERSARITRGMRELRARIARNPERYPTLRLPKRSETPQRAQRLLHRLLAKLPAMAPVPQGWLGPLVIPAPIPMDGAPCFIEPQPSRWAALTFDDGPHPATTPALLEMLQRLEVPATFFPTGLRARENPSLCGAIAAAGMELGQHSMSHAPLSSLEAALQAAEIEEGRRAIEAAGGVEVRLFRPPYGAFDGRTLHAAATARQTIVGWNVSAEDWRDADPARIARRVVAQARSVAIVLLHEGYRATIDAVPHIVASYRKAGYRFVTVSELLARVSPSRLRSTIPVAVA